MTREQLRTLVLTAWQDRNPGRPLNPADRPLSLTLAPVDWAEVLREAPALEHDEEVSRRRDLRWLWRGVPVLESAAQPVGQVTIQWPA